MQNDDDDDDGSARQQRAKGQVANPSQGLHPEMLTEKVGSKTCAIWKPLHTSKEDANGKKKTTIGRAHKGSCPLTWAWKDGQPALRLCHAHKTAGRLVPVADAHDALVKGHALCAEWAQRTSTDRQFATVAKTWSDEKTQYVLGRVKPRRRKRRT